MSAGCSGREDGQSQGSGARYLGEKWFLQSSLAHCAGDFWATSTHDGADNCSPSGQASISKGEYFMFFVQVAEGRGIGDLVNGNSGSSMAWRAAETDSNSKWTRTPHHRDKTIWIMNDVSIWTTIPCLSQ